MMLFDLDTMKIQMLRKEGKYLLKRELKKEYMNVQKKIYKQIDGAERKLLTRDENFG